MLSHFNHLISSIKSFKKRGGFHIFFSTIFSKICGFIASFVIVRLVSKNDYGVFSYALSFIVILLPFSGCGLNYSFLRFGVLKKTAEEKWSLFIEMFIYGLLYSFICFIIISIISMFIPFNITGTKSVFILLLLQIITIFPYEILNSYLRVLKQNNTFALSTIIFSLVYLFSNLSGTYLWGLKGSITAKIISPFISTVILIIITKELFKFSFSFKKSGFEYEKYGLYVGVGSIANQLLYSLDTIMLGYFIVQSDIIAEYRVATIIPFSLMFIPIVFMQTDFVNISENYKNASYLRKYFQKISFLMFIISSILLLFFMIFSKDILILIFGKQYAVSSSLFNVFLIGLIGAFSFRIPLGNILAAVGLSKQNAIVAYIMLGLDIIFNFILIKQFGAKGAAVASALVMWLSGGISYYLFKRYLNKIDTPVHSVKSFSDQELIKITISK